MTITNLTEIKMINQPKTLTTAEKEEISLANLRWKFTVVMNFKYGENASWPDAPSVCQWVRDTDVKMVTKEDYKNAIAVALPWGNSGFTNQLTIIAARRYELLMLIEQRKHCNISHDLITRIVSILKVDKLPTPTEQIKLLCELIIVIKDIIPLDPDALNDNLSRNFYSGAIILTHQQYLILSEMRKLISVSKDSIMQRDLRKAAGNIIKYREVLIIWLEELLPVLHRDKLRGNVIGNILGLLKVTPTTEEQFFELEKGYYDIFKERNEKHRDSFMDRER
jgi:hypothetical protein